MHHHYLSRAPWNADMKHVGELRSWIIFGRQPGGICVESSSHCFLLLRTLGTNIYQSTNYWTHVCPGTCKHSVYREGCVCARIPVEEFIVCNMCLAQFCLQTYVVQKGPVGDWAVAPCSNLLFEVCSGRFRQRGSSRERHLHHLDSHIDFKAAGGQIDAKERMFFPWRRKRIRLLATC